MTEVRGYSVKVARDADSRIRLIESKIDLDLDSIVRSEKKTLQLIGDLRENPRRVLRPDVQRRSVAAYLFAVKRFYEFRGGRTVKKWSRGL